MAVIRNTASMMLKGKIGNTTYYTSKGRQLARQAQNNSNYGANASRTPIQQSRRVMWPNLVNFYSANKTWMRKSFEGLKAGVSEFNKFIQLNINTANVALTKQEAQSKIWVPSKYRVSQGSLPSITRLEEIDGSKTEVLNFTLGDFTPSATATRGQLYQALLDNNANLKIGDAIVAIAFSGTLGAPGQTENYRPASYRYEEFVIDPADNTPLKDGEFANVGEFLVITDFMSGLAVFIHTRTVAGKLLVSTEDMVQGYTDADIEAWSTDTQKNKAIASYGENAEVILAPGPKVEGSTSAPDNGVDLGE